MPNYYAIKPSNFLPANQDTSRLWVFFLWLLCLMASNISVFGQAASVYTDKADYLPGDIVIIEGDGWQAGEQVKLEIDHSTISHGNTVLYATANNDGHIYNDEYLIQDIHFGESFVLYATGLNSGLKAQTTFTDGLIIGSVAISSQTPVSVTRGNSASYTVTVSRKAKSTIAFDAELTIANGLPAGVTATFNPAKVNFSANEESETSVLTLTTASSTPAGNSTFQIRAKVPGSNGESEAEYVYGTLSVIGNTVPVANNDNFVTDEDTQLSLNVSQLVSNDKDQDNDALTVTAVSTPENGTVAFNNGEISFTPAQNYSGTQAGFTYSISDGKGGIASATVNITVNAVNDVPTLGALHGITISEDAGQQTINLSGITTGAANESQTLTITATSSNTAVIPHPAVDYTSANTTGSLTFTPVANANTDSGPVTITVTVNDGGSVNNSVTRTFSVTVSPVNDAPVVANSIARVEVEEDAASTVINLTKTFSDADADDLVVTVSGNDNPSLVTASYNAATKALTLDYQADKNGNAIIKVKASDGSAFAEETFEVKVNAVNDAPVLSAITAKTLNEGTTLNFSASATDVDNAANVLTYSLTGTVPAGAAITESGDFSWTPAEDQDGEHTFTVKVSDGNLTDIEQLTVLVKEVNTAPQLAVSSNETGNEGVALHFTAQATDEDKVAGVANTLTFSLENAPDGASITTAGTFSWIPAEDQDGEHTFTVKVSDGKGAEDSREVKITVNEVNVKPVFAALGNKEVDELIALKFTAQATDEDKVAGVANTLTYSLENESHGATINSNTGAFSWTPTEAQGNGTSYSFTVKVSDEAGASDEKSFSVLVNEVNVAPVASNDNYTVNEDTQLIVAANGLLSNDTDEDLPANTLTATLASPVNGSLVIQPDGSFTYVPVLNYTGTVSFTYKVSDGAGASDVATFTITVLPVNDAPVISNNGASQQVHYSDPVTPVTVSAADVDNSFEQLTATTSWRVGTATFQNGLPGGLSLSKTATNWVLNGKMMVAPGTYTVRVTVNDGTSDAASNSGYTDILIVVTPEDARVTYTGAVFASTASATSGKVTVTLSATVQDITAATGDPAYDSYAGDIRTARVKFVNRDNNTDISGWLTPGLVTASDLKTGTVTFNWATDIGTKSYDTYTVGIVVNNQYTRNTSTDNTTINVAKPLSDFITGGGFIILSNASGLVVPKQATRSNFGFNVKYNKGGTNLQGNINTIVRSENGKVYQIKGNVMTSLAVNSTNKTATFNGKASIQDITNPTAPVSVDGNATLQVTMLDAGEPGTFDKIAITVWNKAGGLWFASNWNGTKTIEQLLTKGNLKVSSNSSFNTTSTARTSAEEPAVGLVTKPVLRNYPNPFRESTMLEFTLAQEDAYTLDIYDAKGTWVERLQTGRASAGVVNEVVWNAGKYPVGMYMVRLTTSTSVQYIKAIIR